MAKIHKKDIRLVVEIGDTHCGSTVGLLPPDFELIEGQKIRHNTAQEWLWACYEDCKKRLWDYVADDPFALILKGDLCEGVHHKTKQVISVDVADHIRAVTETLKPLVERAAKVFVLAGTEVHTGSKEDTYAKMIGAVPDPNTRKAAWDRLALDVCGVRYCSFHHITTSSREYLRASALGIFLGNEQLAAAKNGEKIPRVLTCAHRHTFDQYRNESGVCWVTPSWQIPTRFVGKVAPSARCHVGLVVGDWRKRENGELPDVEPILCRAPAAVSAEL